MKYAVVIGVLLLCTASAFATSTIGDLQFATNYDTLMAQAKDSHKVVVLKFFTDW